VNATEPEQYVVGNEREETGQQPFDGSVPAHRGGEVERHREHDNVTEYVRDPHRSPEVADALRIRVWDRDENPANQTGAEHDDRRVDDGGCAAQR
jgi:hypothetical protein